MYQLPRHLLPPKLLEIAEYCGDSTAMALLQHYGGGHLCVPHKVDMQHPLSLALGVEAAAKFCQLFAGEIINMPRAAKAMRTLRNAEMRRLRGEGWSCFQLARHYHLTERQVITICNGMEEQVGQVDLFDFEV